MVTIDWQVFFQSIAIWFRFLGYIGLIISLGYVVINKYVNGDNRGAIMHVSMIVIFSVFVMTMFISRILGYTNIAHTILDIFLTTALITSNFIVWRNLIVDERKKVRQIEEKVNGNLKGEHKYA